MDKEYKEYTVNWSIQLDATDPVDAARKALEVMRDPSSISDCYEVDTAEGETHNVDLSLEDNKWNL